MTDSIDARVARARSELETTLTAIEDRLNVPKRVNEAVGAARASIAEDPVPWIVAAAAGVAVLAGAITAAIFVANRDD